MRRANHTKKRVNPLFILLFFLIYAQAFGDSVYKWTDKKGRVVYSESIPKDLDIEVEIINTGSGLTTIAAPEKIQFRNRAKRYGVIKELKARKSEHASCSGWRSQVENLNDLLRKSNPVERVTKLKRKRRAVKELINQHC